MLVNSLMGALMSDLLGEQPALFATELSLQVLSLLFYYEGPKALEI